MQALSRKSTIHWTVSGKYQYLCSGELNNYQEDKHHHAQNVDELRITQQG